MTPDQVAAIVISLPIYALLTAGLIAISMVIIWRVPTQQMRLILLGVLLAVAAIGYGNFLSPIQVSDAATSVGNVPSGLYLASTLMRIAVILVLTGLAWLLLAGPGESSE